MRWRALKDLPITLKLFLASGLTLCALLLLAAVAFNDLEANKRHFRELSEGAFETFRLTVAAKDAAFEVQVRMLDAILVSATEVDKTRVVPRLEAVEQSLKRAQFRFEALYKWLGADSADAVKLREALKDYVAPLDEVRHIVRDDPASAWIVVNEVRSGFAQLNDRLALSLARADVLRQFSARQAAADAARAGSVFVVIVIVTVGFSALITVVAARSITTPIIRLTRAMSDLAAGNLEVSVPEVRRRDEVGSMAAAMQVFKEGLIDANRLRGERDAARARELERARQFAEAAERERQRLDVALTNMAQGLCMFDAGQRLVVFNKRVAEIFKIPPGGIFIGMPMRELMMLAQATDKNPEAANAAQAKLLAEPLSGTAVTTLNDGTTISITHRPMSEGGFLVTFEDITERLRAEERIRHLAQFDALTDLPNRVTFYEQMEQVLRHLRRAETVGVLSLDLDHFKNVNDTLGHPIGDLLLKAVAERLRGCVRDEDIVARLGGDEFAIVQVPSSEPANPPALAMRLIEAIGAPYELDGHQVVLGVSVGIAIAPDDGHEPDLLMKNADLALYRAKADGGGTYRFFELEMDARMQARHAIELDLRRAVVNGEFEVYYQPIIDLKSERTTSCEALIRWHHPRRGMVQPMEFIPVAEETGLIVAIGEWVLRQACAEAARWPHDITVSVNLSPAQFKNRNLVQTVVGALASSGIAPDRLELEITELVLLQENEGAFAVLHQLRDLGIKIAMDDFGTGYSSLGYLRSFPFDKIKIDQSFVRDLPAKEDSVAIIRAVVGLSSSLGITTTAEGVETREQLESLRREGCSEVQGFLLAEPKPAGEMRDLLARSAEVSAVA